MRDKRGVVVGLVVGFIASAAVGASSGTPVIAFGLSVLCVLVVVTAVWLFAGVVRR